MCALLLLPTVLVLRWGGRSGVYCLNRSCFIRGTGRTAWGAVIIASGGGGGAALNSPTIWWCAAGSALRDPYTGRPRGAVASRRGGRDRGGQAGEESRSSANASMRTLRAGACDGQHPPPRALEARLPCPHPRGRPRVTGMAGEPCPPPWPRREQWRGGHRPPGGHPPRPSPVAVGARSPGAPVWMAFARARLLGRGGGGALGERGGGEGGGRGRHVRDVALPGGPVLERESGARRSLRPEGGGSPTGGGGTSMGQVERE